MRNSALKNLARMALGLILPLAFATAALAVDGVIEINQVKALDGGITPGDTAGFPVSITLSGSYRLTGNLTVPNENTHGIVVSTGDVTIDLNGFAILGAVSCLGTPPVCSPSTGSGDGISTGSSRLTVINGTIRGMGGNGINAGFGDSRIENVHVTSNIGDGILGSQEAIIRGNTVRLNGGNGIRVFFGSLVLENTITFNGGFGILLDSPNGGYANNTLRGNNSAGGFVQVCGGTEIGINLCGGGSVCSSWWPMDP